MNLIGILHCSLISPDCRCDIKTNSACNQSYLLIILICLYTVQNSSGIFTVRLSDLKAKQTAIIRKVSRTTDGESALHDVVASRLETLGFVPGTKVQVITKGIFGGDPILIQVGFTRFALRKSEAAKIEIEQAVSA